jgi:HEPN domain-containing protein
MLDLDDEVLAVARQWAAKAENDLKNAAHTVRLKTDCPTDTVCFHVQQCVEKYLKALLVLNDIEFSRTHQISTLLALVPASIRPVLTPQEQDLLTEYAVTTRYPGDYDPISHEEARQAVQLARRLRNQVRPRLPEAIRQATTPAT